MLIACHRWFRIRKVPDALHRKLKIRPAEAGQTLSDYLLAELERLAERPTRDESSVELTADDGFR